MSLFAFCLVMGAVFSHAAWNFIVKSSTDRLGALVIMLLGVTVVGLTMIPFVPVPDQPRIWMLIGISALLHYAYNISLLLAYRFADLSIAYPIARGAVPLIVLFLAYAILGQLPSPVGVSGVFCVAGGIMMLAFFARKLDIRGVGLALLTSVWIAGYSVVDGMGVREANYALSFVAWNFASHALIPLVVYFGIWQRKIPINLQFRRQVLGGILSPLAYGLVLWAQLTTDFAAVSALRETSVIVASLLGILVLGEGQARLRLSAAACVCVGATLIVTG